MPTTTALRYHQYGTPAETLKLEELPLDEPKEGEALVKCLAAPVNPADFGRVGGTYGDLAPLPAVGGLEGVGEIVALGGGSTQFRVGQRVFIPSSVGSWQTAAVIPYEELYPAPEKLPVEQAAMGWVNPATAWQLMHQFVKLKAGDILVQNAPTSAVGRFVIQIADHLGIKTINLARSLDEEHALKELGADIVLIDDRGAAKAALEATKGKKAKLALNSIGGSSALGMCKLLADRGVLVTFGGMDREPAPFPTRYLIFNDIQLRGFWMTHWYATASREEIYKLHNDVFTFMENSKSAVKVIARYRLDQFKDAFEHAQKPGKGGKVMFDLSGDLGPH
ncbi:2-enoyl thioester reductase domain-containing protein [Pelagicoccus sp. SDUM812003]|uniref:MDR family NADPH-dependent oxidoreductase n=1 Tax=Pelagicoccus sp. SDUM812003 TaxID=3041267 RepID=UPI00280EC065|nr:2-enoyl thioester reductase domain-containing protein [Pelagicoccus sp. SDUM812003]MDQ8202463.1 2-enoyl thioester reductase domain-containing protein [Pelagicoccus sp. SDUM812003]